MTAQPVGGALRISPWQPSPTERLRITMHRRWTITAASLAATALVATTAGPAAAHDPAPAASGSTNPLPSPARISGGTTSLALRAEVGAALTEAGISVAPTDPAATGPDGIGFPIVAGSLDPATGAGILRHEGGLRFSKGKRSITISQFDVRIARRSTLTAKINGLGVRARVINLDTSNAEISSDAVSVSASGIEAKLNGPAARLLNFVLKTRAFAPGLDLGSVKVAAKRSTIRFEGGATTLKLDAGAAAALTSLGVSVTPSSPAQATADGLAFPIVGGQVDAATLAGVIRHTGGITFTAGGTSLTVSNFVIDTTRGVLTAQAGGSRIDLLKLDLSAPQVAVDGDEVTVGNVGASLTKVAADALNATFKVSAFTENLKIGVATVDGETF